MDIAIETIGLSKTFLMGEIPLEVLKNIDLTIHKEEFVSIMGPSGSGKSTLLYLMGGLDKPTRGEVRVLGHNLKSLNDNQESQLRRNSIGFVFQFYNLIPNLTVEENVLLPILLDGKRPRDFKEPLDEILAIVGLGDRRSHTPRELSGGQQQRVAIARALINGPEIILADEPTGNLDSTTTTEVMELLQRINREQKKTIVQVTHSLEGADYGTRIINVRDGRVLK